MKILIILSVCLHFTLGSISGNREKIKIGAIFDKKSEHLVKTFTLEVSKYDQSDGTINFEQTHTVVDCQDSFLVSNAVCELLESGVFGIIGAFQSCALSTIQSYTDTFKVPFISLSMPQEASSAEPYQLYIKPAYIEGLLDILYGKGWSKVYYIYESDEGLVRLQQLFQKINAREINLDIIVKRIQSVTDGHQLLRKIYDTDNKEDLRIFLDLSLDRSQDLITTIKHDPDVSNYRLHFLLVDLGINDMNSTALSAGMNISGFSLKKEHDPNTFIHYRTFGDILVRDAVLIFHRALKKAPLTLLERDTPRKCRDNEGVIHYRPGKAVLHELKKGENRGISGLIKFDAQGWRKDFELPFHETRMNMGIAKIGTYYSDKPEPRITLHEPEIVPPPSQNYTTQQTVRKIVTVAEDPYVMFNERDKSKQKSIRCGVENFHGYIIDLIDKVTKYLKLNYTLCLAKDGIYGKKQENGTWTGVIGELTRGTADIAFSAMTISSERERVVDFTKPFMSLGISIMIKKPTNKKAHTFSFMDPLSYEIWMCILFAYVGVSVVLFLVSRFSPTEWHVENDRTIKNDFTISNSLWYSLGAFMQQGCDISPKSVSGRIVGSVWWFFTLIIISSYTANLAAFLTVERMNTPIESAEDLAKQTQIQYGVYEYGTTADFFRLSKVAVYERMWAYMTSAKNVFVKSTSEGVSRVRSSNGKYAYLIESSTNEFINSRKPCDTMKVGSNLDSKGYGIATPIGSDLRDQLTLAVLHLREKGDLQSLKKKWWDDRSECGEQNSAMDGSEAELKLHNVAGIFYILIGGLSLSVIIAGLEFLYRSIVDSKKTKQAFGTIVRNKARLSFRGSMDSGNPESTTPLKKSGSSGTYTYTGPTQLPGFDPYVDTNTHTQV